MMIGFWILIALLIAGLWGFGRGSGWKARCDCEAVPAGRDRNGESKRRPGGDSQDSPGPWR